MSLLFLTSDQGSSTSVYAATQPRDAKEVAEGYFYYMPYVAFFNILLPFELVGPYCGWNAVRPRLPPNVDNVARELWEMSERLVLDANQRRALSNGKVKQ